MAYTTDRTWVTGEVVTAAFMNTYVRDNIKWLSTDKPMARAYASAAVSHTTSGSYQELLFNSNRFDNSNIHSTSTNTARFTVPTGGAGKWLFGGTIGWVASAAANYRYASVGLNGSVTDNETATISDVTLNAKTSIVTMYDVTVAQWFSLFGWQNSGGALNMTANSNAWAMWMSI